MRTVDNILQIIRLYSRHKKLTRTDVEVLAGIMALILVPNDIESTKSEVMLRIFKPEKAS